MTNIRLVSSGLILSSVVAAAGCAPVITDNPIYYPNGKLEKHDNHKKHDNHNKHKNNDYKKASHTVVERQATHALNAMGYGVEKVDYKEKQGIVKAKAYRGGSKYKIDLSYPSMQVVKLKKD